jgi:hypothetical protein
VDPPSGGLRLAMARPSAPVTRVAVWAASLEQPTIRRENTSSTTAQSALPSEWGARCYRSPTADQDRYG